MLGGITHDDARQIAGGLAGLIGSGEGSTPEQQSILDAIVNSAWGVTLPITPLDPAVLRGTATTQEQRRRVVQIAIVLELSRHPRSNDLIVLVEELAAGLGVGSEELAVVRAQATASAEAATTDFIRRYDEHIDALTEPTLLVSDRVERDALLGVLQTFADLPVGSVGRAFVDFHERNGLRLPSPTTPEPAYYVSHDMNHVIAGYEPTGPGEIALGAFKLAMGDTEANWMAFMANLMIHEAGLFKHGTDVQFTPWGGGIYRDDGGEGALHLEGAAALLGEAWARGAATTTDFSQIDHLALAPLPLVEVRRRFGVIPRADGYDGGTGGPWPT